MFKSIYFITLVICGSWVAKALPADGKSADTRAVSDRPITALAARQPDETMRASATGRQIGFGFGVGGWPYGPNFGISLGGGYPAGYWGYGDYYGGHHPEHYHHHHDHHDHHGHHDHGYHDYYGHDHYRG